MRCKECNKKMFSVMEFEKGKMSRFYICPKCKYETPKLFSGFHKKTREAEL